MSALFFPERSKYIRLFKSNQARRRSFNRVQAHFMKRFFLFVKETFGLLCLNGLIKRGCLIAKCIEGLVEKHIRRLLNEALRLQLIVSDFTVKHAIDNTVAKETFRNAVGSGLTDATVSMSVGLPASTVDPYGSDVYLEPGRPPHPPFGEERHCHPV